MIWCIKTYIIAYVKTQKIRLIIHYVKPTAQLLFKIRFPKGVPTSQTTFVSISTDGRNIHQSNPCNNDWAHVGMQVTY